jgi:uncharacterized protein (UPF0264 family)
VRLLVSVRDAVEAAAAVDGGAEIVDAKEPAAGSLGAVAPAVLAAIRKVVPSRLEVSAALGDVADEAGVERALGEVRVSLAYVKLGFLGVADRGRVKSLLERGVNRTASLPGRPRLIAVAYADWRETGGLPPAELAELVTESGASGLLVDTAIKDGTTLFDHCRVDELAAIGRAIAGDGRLYALGGTLALPDLPRASATGATVFGVRTAACEGGRQGAVTVSRVRLLADATRRVGVLA